MSRWKRPIEGGPAEPGAVSGGHQSKAEKAVSLRLSEERLRWQRIKNEKAEMELKAKQGSMVYLDDIKREVLAANNIVKQQVLAVIERANLPRDVRLALRREMITVLKELAYECLRDPEKTI